MTAEQTSLFDRRAFLAATASAAVAAPAVAQAQAPSPAGPGPERSTQEEPKAMERIMSEGSFSKSRLARMHDVHGRHVESGDVPGLVTLVAGAAKYTSTRSASWLSAGPRRCAATRSSASPR